MNQNQIIKSFYHFVASVLILYVVFYVKINIVLKVLLFFIAIFHLYDVWWFYNNDGNVPI